MAFTNQISAGERVTLFAISLLPAVVWWLFFPSYFGADDAYIHKAIVENWVGGRGWGVNPGEAVGLSTAPLFSLIASALSVLPGDLLFKGSLFTQLASVLGCYLAGLTAQTISGDRAAGILACLFAVSNAVLWRWTGTFMETTVAFAAVMGVVYVFFRLQSPSAESAKAKQYFWLGVLCGLTSLLRPELGMLPFLIVASMFIMAVPRTLLFALALFGGAGVVAVIYVVFATQTWGSVLPSTYSAKTSDAVNLLNLQVTVQLAGVVVSSALGACLAIVIWGVIKIRQSDYDAFRRVSLLLMIPIMGFLFFYAKTDSLQSPGRYFLPFYGVLSILGGVAAAQVARRMSSALALVGLQAALSLAFLAVALVPVLRGMESGYVASMLGVSETLDEVCTEGDVVLIAFDLGVVADSNRSACTIADGGGLASPELQRMTVPEMLSSTGATYLIHSLGSDEDSMANWVPEHGFDLTEVYRSDFPSHGVTEPDRIYTVRLFRVGAAD